jgi:hypothetical protein
MATDPQKHLGLDEPLAEPEPDTSVLQPASPEGADTPERPEWLDQRFDSPEEQAKAYREAERRMHDTLQANAELEKRLAALEERIPEQPQEPQYDYSAFSDPMQQAAYRDQLSQLAEENPLAAMEALLNEREQLWQMQQAAAWQQQQVAAAAYQPQMMQQQQTQAALVANEAKRNVTSRHEDFSEYEDQVAQILTDDPEFIAGQHSWDLSKLERGLERAYRIAKAEALTAREQELRDQGVDPAEIERQRKMNAQTMQGVSARPDEPSAEEKQLAAMVESGMQSYGAARNSIWGPMRAPTS